MADNSRISKLISLMLRHRPDEFGLEIDAYGFVPLDQVLQAVQERYEEVVEEDILTLLNAPDQRRFELTENGVRALYGHSFYVEMDGEPMEPPERLYMGTTAIAANRFSRDGVSPGDRNYVHLSLSLQAAEARSREPGGPCVIEILAKEASEAGVEFHARGEVVLTREIPAEFVGAVHGVNAIEKKQSQKPTGQGAVTFGRKPHKATR